MADSGRGKGESSKTLVWVEDSVILHLILTVFQPVQRAHATSLLIRLTKTGLTYGQSSILAHRLRSVNDYFRSLTRSSFLYRWLATDPDPDPIVIDLRDSFLLRPIVRIIGKSLYTHNSSLTFRVANTLKAEFEKSPIRLTSALLLPPMISVFLIPDMLAASSIPEVIPMLVILFLIAGGTQLDSSWAAISKSKTIKFVIGIFSPPE